MTPDSYLVVAKVLHTPQGQNSVGRPGCASLWRLAFLPEKGPRIAYRRTPHGQTGGTQQQLHRK